MLKNIFFKFLRIQSRIFFLFFFIQIQDKFCFENVYIVFFYILFYRAYYNYKLIFLKFWMQIQIFLLLSFFFVCFCYKYLMLGQLYFVDMMRLLTGLCFYIDNYMFYVLFLYQVGIVFFVLLVDCLVMRMLYFVDISRQFVYMGFYINICLYFFFDMFYGQMVFVVFDFQYEDGQFVDYRY